jgi:hypothetical protein
MGALDEDEFLVDDEPGRCLSELDAAGGPERDEAAERLC